MRLILGLILGAALTVAGAYIYDSRQNDLAAGPSATEHRQMVNWDVVNDNWRRLRLRAQSEWNRLAAG